MMYSYMRGEYVDLPQPDYSRDYLWSLIKINSRDRSIIYTSIGCVNIDFNDASDADYKIGCIIYESDPSWNDGSELGDPDLPTYWKGGDLSESQGIYNGTLVIYDPETQEDLVEYMFDFIPV